MMLRKQLLLALFMLCHLSTAYTNDLLEAGVYAFERGDYQASLQNWLPLAEAGHAEAQLFMGVLYRYGLAVEKNPQQSAYWYGRAAENGDVDAQNELGFFYELGWGVKQDIWQAESWYEQVREQDVCLSDTLATGRLVVMDE